MKKVFRQSIMHMLPLVGMIFSLSTIDNLQAQTIDPDVAMQRALSLRPQSNRAMASSRKNQVQPLTLVHKSEQQGHTHYYVFDYPDGGFAIIGGDAAAREVLGYCDHGSFNPDRIPDGLKFMLDYYDWQIGQAIEQNQQNGNTAPEAASPKTQTAGRTTIPAMVKTQWGQDEPFNSQLPKLGPEYGSFVTGCVATATAQVMKFWNYPTQGIGCKAIDQEFLLDDDETRTLTFTADFGHTTYEWSKMPNTYAEYTSQAQKQAVGTLMYHVGVAHNMQYGLYDSRAGAICGFVLESHFGYDPNAQHLFRDDYTDGEWENLIYNELRAGRPIIYSGNSGWSGHTFVCDGYDASLDFFHFNWGWYGDSDGYYPLTGVGALQPNSSGIGGAGIGKDYTQMQDAWIGIKPASKPQPVLATEMNLIYHDAELDLGQQLKLQYQLEPMFPSYQMLDWQSSDPSVAVVDQYGTVTAKAYGTATITATTKDGTHLKDQCIVTVMHNSPVVIGTAETINALVYEKRHSTSHFIYSAKEVGPSRTIDALSLLVLGTALAPEPADVEIWLGLTTADEFTQPYPLFGEAPLTLVYSDRLEYGTHLGWEKYEFNAPFEYDDNYNLLVVFTQSTKEHDGNIYYAVTNSPNERKATLIRSSYTDSSYADINNVDNYTIYDFGGWHYRPDIKLWTAPGTVMQCGENLFAEYYSNGQLSIYGTGEMYDYDYLDIPWRDLEINSVVVEEGVTRLSQFAIDNFGIQSLYLPSTLTQIDDYTIANLPNLQTIQVASSNPVFSDGAGHNLLIDENAHRVIISGIYNNYIPDGIQIIGHDAFQYNFSTQITMPNSVTTIEGSAFARAPYLASVEFSDHLTSIGPGAFFNCMYLTSIQIPSQVESIGSQAFSACYRLRQLSVHPDNQTFDSREHCNAIIRTADNTMISACYATIIPASVQTIAECAFSYVYFLESIDIPDGVTRIDDLAFLSCDNLASVKIPSTVFNIGHNTFVQCNRLTSIYVGTMPSGFYDDSFDQNHYDNATLYIPEGYGSYYLTDNSPWTKFKNVKYYLDSSMPPTYDNTLYIDPIATRPGSSVSVPILLRNSSNVVGFQFEIELPRSVTPFTLNDNVVVNRNGERLISAHTVTVAQPTENTIRVVCLGYDSSRFVPIKGNDGELFTLTLNVAEGAWLGKHQLRLSNIKIQGQSGSYSACDYLTDFLIYPHIDGDINHDGRITVEDLATLVAGLRGDRYDYLCVHCADIDHNNEYDECDVEALAQLIAQEPAPANDARYVDLGIRDAKGRTIYWAKTNLGDYSAAIGQDQIGNGQYFAWGENQGFHTPSFTAYRDYSWSKYQYCYQSDQMHLNKYTFADGNTSAIWYNGGTTFCGDNKKRLEPSNDAAYFMLGPGWRIPSAEEMQMLIDQCDWTWITDDAQGTTFARVSNRHDPNKYILLPLGGYAQNSMTNIGSGTSFYYWTSTLSGQSSTQGTALTYDASSGLVQLKAIDRCLGLPIRPIFVR